MSHKISGVLYINSHAENVESEFEWFWALMITELASSMLSRKYLQCLANLWCAEELYFISFLFVFWMTK